MGRNYNIDLQIARYKIIKSLRFYDIHGHLPEYNEFDKEEMELYEYCRKVDFKLYKNDIEKELYESYMKAIANSKNTKASRKKEKLRQRRIKVIDKSINDYYEFYLKHGYFPSDSNLSSKEEKSISKSYTRIKTLDEYITFDQKRMILMIDQIKMKKENRRKLKNILSYVKYYEENGKTAVRKSKNLNEENKLTDEIARKMSNIRLEEVLIPRELLQRLLTSVTYSDDSLAKKVREDVNLYNLHYR